jgi:S-DNA-T family DNA segregation ATPase FtsK/SpoIIIE
VAGGYRRRSARSYSVPGPIVRQVIGYVLIILGVMMFIGLAIKGGTLTDYEWNIVAPWFGTIRWLLPFVLLVCGYDLIQPQTSSRDWQLTVFGAVLAFLCVDGFTGLVLPGRSGSVGSGLANFVGQYITRPGAGLMFAILFVAGVLVALDMSFPMVMKPFGELISRATERLFRPAPATQPDRASGTAQPGTSARPARQERPLRSDKTPLLIPSGQAGMFGDDLLSPIPPVVPDPGFVSSTFAPSVSSPVRPATPASPGAGEPWEMDEVRDGTLAPKSAGAATGIRSGAPVRGVKGGQEARETGADVSDAAVVQKPKPEYHLPPNSLLDDIAPSKGDTSMDHERHAAIIESKLASFNIPARVVAWNAGPVVTQYEVAPSPDIKVSRIEALSDDLAMALAARTIRIEAPIPGKTVVGLEIPNKDFNIVALRRILEEADFSGSKLTFALGRDVAGHARATDLAKMPHLLIAGATGSGKSVMVNALITSLLCNATPDEVRLVLVDLKRVELASYNGLPHLMVPVITEPERAKAALKWAVIEMENRYRKFAGATARNLAGYNESRVDPADRLPYLVVIIDELADLMMREGKNIEDPIVRLAQKARATGIHLVLATQRPSVNVVTGLIKANFPSRIAFAMASQIDSRTILDMPGAEDLIGRGDMLFQPADVPRPIRLQGVFVSDKEIRNVVQHWQAEAEPHYDMGILDTGEEEPGSVQTVDEEADRLLPDAISVIQEYDRASASLLQRRLKIGYARAARIIDQLEARGFVGPFEGSSARQVLRRDTAAPGDRPYNGHGEDEE